MCHIPISFLHAKKILKACYLIFLAALIDVFVKALALAQDSAGLNTSLGTTLKSISQLSDNDKKMVLGGFGLPQGSDFDAAKIIACLIFGGIGFVAFMYGKKTQSWRPLATGILLLVYPYFFSSTIAVYLVGIILTAVLYFWRE
jgi:hypothetical protein